MNTIRSLLAQKSWSNKELFNLLLTVDRNQHAEAVHTAIRTLNHIFVVDRIFKAHLSGEPHGYSGTNTQATPELEELHFNVTETDAWYLNYASNLPVDRLNDSVVFFFTDGDAGRMTREEILMHIVTHGAYHRGNVGQILKSISIVPPRDLYTKFLHVSEPERRQG